MRVHLKNYNDLFISNILTKDEMFIDLKSRKKGNVNCSKIEFNEKKLELIVAVDPYGVIPKLSRFYKDNKKFHTKNIEMLAADISNYFYEKADNYLDKNSLPNYEVYSPVTSVFKVMRRVQLCNKMEYEDLKDILYTDYEGLCAYLLLTCFDILGSRNNYINFGDWLISKKREYTYYRDLCLSDIEEYSDYQQKTQKLYKLYLKKFGVNKSFRYFIYDILSEKERSLIFGLNESDLKKISKSNELTENEVLLVKSLFKGMISIEYAYKKADSKYDIVQEESRAKLLKRIQDIRNNFTHSGFSIEGFSPTHQSSLIEKESNYIPNQLNIYIQMISDYLQCPVELVNNLKIRLFQQNIENNGERITEVYFNTLINRLKYIVIRGIERKIELIMSE